MRAKCINEIKKNTSLSGISSLNIGAAHMYKAYYIMLENDENIVNSPRIKDWNQAIIDTEKLENFLSEIMEVPAKNIGMLDSSKLSEEFKSNIWPLTNILNTTYYSLIIKGENENQSIRIYYNSKCGISYMAVRSENDNEYDTFYCFRMPDKNR